MGWFSKPKGREGVMVRRFVRSGLLYPRPEEFEAVMRVREIRDMGEFSEIEIFDVGGSTGISVSEAKKIVGSIVYKSSVHWLEEPTTQGEVK